MLIKSYEGVIRQNTGAYFGFTGESFGYILALILIPTLFISYNYSKISKYFAQKIELFFIGMYLIGIAIVFITNNIFFGSISFLSIYIAQEVAKPYIIGLINKRTESKHRATAISTVSLLSEIPYMIVVLFFGILIQIENLKYYYGLLFLAVLLYAFFHLARGKYSKVDERTAQQ